jgi:DNA repair protein RecO (recombination protein O)
LIIKTSGIVVSGQAISERDKLITILTEKEGLIRAFAKGVKSFKGFNSLASSLFCYSDFVFYKGRNSYNLSEACAIKFFFDLRNNLEKLSLAEYFCELIISLCVQPQEAKEILRLVLNSLHFLSKETIPRPILKSVFEIKILSASGYLPNLLNCKKCLTNCEDEFYLVIKEGSLYCKKCFCKSKNPCVKLSRGALFALRYVISSPLKKAFHFSISEESKRKFCRACEEYTINCIEKKIHTLTFYKQVCKI